MKKGPNSLRPKLTGVSADSPTSDTPKLKILLLAASGRYVYTHRAHLVRTARKLGHTFIVVAPEAEKYFPPPCDNITLNRTNINPLKEISTIWNLVALYRQHKPDVVHHVGLKPALIGSIAAWICRVPRVVHAVSGLGAAWDRRLIRGTIRLMMRLLWRESTVLVQNEVDEAFIQGTAQRIIKLPGAGVDLKAFTPPDCEPKPTPFIITLASRMLWTKGVGIFVEAVQQLRQQGLPIEGWLVGGVDTVNPQAITRQQLNEWRHIVTWLDERDDIAQIYQQTHVVVLPTFYREGVPKALIEAAACGRPILTTNRPGCNQVVTDGENGFFVESTDDVVRRIRQLYKDPQLRAWMGAAGRKHAEKTFDERNVTHATLAAYY